MKDPIIEEISERIANAMISDELKKRIIVKLAMSRQKMSEQDFKQVVEETEKLITETERMLN